jgi:hypothetical protein
MDVSITPAATEEEAAAIAAAIEILWPTTASAVTDAGRAPVWRFSGRWWSQPIPLRRARPWV